MFDNMYSVYAVSLQANTYIQHALHKVHVHVVLPELSFESTQFQAVVYLMSHCFIPSFSALVFPSPAPFSPLHSPFPAHQPTNVIKKSQHEYPLISQHEQLSPGLSIGVLARTFPKGTFGASDVLFGSASTQQITSIERENTRPGVGLVKHGLTRYRVHTYITCMPRGVCKTDGNGPHS